MWPKRSCCTSCDHLQITNAVMPLTVPSTSYDYLELTNAIVLLMMPSVSCDANTVIMWPKGHVAPRFKHLELINKKVSLRMSSTSGDSNISANSILRPTEWCHTLCQSSLPNKKNDAIDDADTNAGTNGITWVKTVIFHFMWTIATWWMQQYYWQHPNHHNIMSRHCLDISRQGKIYGHVYLLCRHI